MREMMRSLLADRFQLRVTHQTKELPVFALVVAKGGPKIAPVKDDNTYNSNDGHNEGWLEIQKMAIEPISALVEVLSRQPEIEGRKVIDQTGLTASYTYTLKWTEQRPLSTRADESDAAQPTSDAPTLWDALQQQLGLQLKSVKAPVDTIVIGHIEKPTPN
jgi:bla regulator protein blaR1